MTYVLQHSKDGKFVADPKWGKSSSYTSKLEHARVFTLDAAKRDACSNETPVLLSTLMGGVF